MTRATIEAALFEQNGFCMRGLLNPKLSEPKRFFFFA